MTKCVSTVVNCTKMTTMLQLLQTVSCQPQTVSCLWQCAKKVFSTSSKQVQ